MSNAARRFPIEEVTDNVGDDQEVVVPAGLFGMFFKEELQDYARQRMQSREQQESES